MRSEHELDLSMGSAARDTHVFLGMCRAAGVPEPETEYRFDATRRFRFDFAWPLHRLALEIEGGIWSRSKRGHAHPLNVLRDIEKGNLAVMRGWRVLRNTPQQLSEALAAVMTLLVAPPR
jgi:hypothetical protein